MGGGPRGRISNCEKGNNLPTPAYQNYFPPDFGVTCAPRLPSSPAPFPPQYQQMEDPLLKQEVLKACRQ